MISTYLHVHSYSFTYVLQRPNLEGPHARNITSENFPNIIFKFYIKNFIYISFQLNLDITFKGRYSCDAIKYLL